MRAIELRADGTGTIELVCERMDRDAPAPRVRTFVGRDEFGLLVDDLTPDERVTLFVDDAIPGREPETQLHRDCMYVAVVRPI